MAEKGKKVICASFRAHCQCRVALLACQAVIILGIFLFYGMFVGRKIPYEDKPIFLLWVGLLTGFSIVALEVIWCRNCPFFRTMVVYYCLMGYFQLVRFFVRLVPAG
jgi:hypothetical protein